MKPTHFHKAAGQTKFVTLHKYKGRDYASDGHRASSIDLYPIEDIIGQVVVLGGCEGVVKEALSDRLGWVSGEYNSGHYMLPKPLQTFNSQVGVYWKHIPVGLFLPPYWNHYDGLEKQ